jgi:hypothetical protein
MFSAVAVNHKAGWVWLFPLGYAVYYVVRYHVIRVLKAQYQRVSGREGVSGTPTRASTAQTIPAGGDARRPAADVNGRVQDGEGAAVAGQDRP